MAIDAASLLTSAVEVQHHPCQHSHVSRKHPGQASEWALTEVGEVQRVGHQRASAGHRGALQQPPPCGCRHAAPAARHSDGVFDGLRLAACRRPARQQRTA
eukprot:3941008-Rhodomonas_salina.3